MVTMKGIVRSGWCVLVAVTWGCLSGSAASVFIDDFDDGLLDPGWEISLIDATGWTFAEAGTELTVTDVISPNPSGVGPYATVVLRQDFAPVSDFTADFDITWDSAGSLAAMQNVKFLLYDVDDNLLATAAYIDAWSGNRGSKAMSAGASNYFSGYDTLPYAGAAMLSVTRTGTTITGSWDSVPVVSGTKAGYLARIDLQFDYFPYLGTTFFGTETVDIIDINGTLIPTPPPPVIGAPVLVDDFDDGVLDPAWATTFDSAVGWTFAEAGTELTVTDVVPPVPTSAGPWARVLLRQDFIPLLDFTADLEFSWESNGQLEAMQSLRFVLYDKDDNVIGSAIVDDAWSSSAPAKLMTAGATLLNTGPSTMPLAATAFVTLARIGSTVTGWWNGVPLITGTASGPLARVDMEFWFFPYLGISLFGTETVDLVAISGVTECAPFETTFLDNLCAEFQTSLPTTNAEANDVIGQIAQGIVDDNDLSPLCLAEFLALIAP